MYKYTTEIIFMIICFILFCFLMLMVIDTNKKARNVRKNAENIQEQIIIFENT